MRPTHCPGQNRTVVVVLRSVTGWDKPCMTLRGAQLIKWYQVVTKMADQQHGHRQPHLHRYAPGLHEMSVVAPVITPPPPLPQPITLPRELLLPHAHTNIYIYIYIHTYICVDDISIKCFFSYYVYTIYKFIVFFHRTNSWIFPSNLPSGISTNHPRLG